MRNNIYDWEDNSEGWDPSDNGSDEQHEYED